MIEDTHNSGSLVCAQSDLMTASKATLIAPVIEASANPPMEGVAVSLGLGFLTAGVSGSGIGVSVYGTTGVCGLGIGGV